MRLLIFMEPLLELHCLPSGCSGRNIVFVVVVVVVVVVVIGGTHIRPSAGK